MRFSPAKQNLIINSFWTERNRRSSAEIVRTPADGQEAHPEDSKTTTPATTISAGIISTTTTTTTTAKKYPPACRAPVPYARSTGPPPPVPAKPGYILPHSTETSSVFINTSEIPVPQATQPTVQKRVVTHVTIFPSPPPDLVTQVSRVQTTPAPPPKPAESKPAPPPIQQEEKEDSLQAPPPPPPVTSPQQEQEPSSVTSEPDQEPPSDISTSEQSAQVGSTGAQVKSEPEVSLQQSSSLEMVNKEPLSSSENEASHPSALATVKGGGGSSGGGGGGGSSGDESRLVEKMFFKMSFGYLLC